MNHILQRCALAILSTMTLISCATSAQAAQVGVWNFNDTLDNAIAGRAAMSAIGWTPAYATQTIGGSSARVLSFPAFDETQSLDMPNQAGVNGPNTPGAAASRNNWSIVMDVRFPTVGNYTALWETDDLNLTDADYFVRDTEGIGTSGQYGGFYDPNAWTRIAVTVDSNVNPGTYTVTGYIDGALASFATTGTSPGGKEAVESVLHLFADEDGETSAGLVNSVAYYGDVLTDVAVGQLGAATAAGIPSSANQVGLWNFNDVLTNSVAGGAPMAAVGGWSPNYVNEMIGGSPARVLMFPAMTDTQALDMPNQAAPDHFGVPPAPPTTTNVWTIVMDVRFDLVGDYASLWETDALFTNDGDFFVRDEEGLGISAQYSGGPLSDPPGTYSPTEWRRIAVTVDGSVSGGGYTLTSYVDGSPVGTAVTDASPDGREAIEAALHLFADNDFETAAGFVNSVAYYDELLTPAAILALGAASATGIPVATDADFDDDGDVDGADLLRWQRNVGTTSGASNGQGDADGNGAVNAADLAVWKGKFGVPAAAVAGAVPEPGSLAFAAAGLASLAVARRNWNRV